ncbi:MAG TPA: hypothetical protein VFY26_08995, partial [Anaerolineales bacterium]|nr:hypothetical protein [Anaerolineales bacterium]
MRKRLTEFSLNERAIPFALLFVTIISFGLLIPWLGFYWDDWPVIYMAETQGTDGFREFYQYDRPFSAWTYILFGPILGTTPLVWHLFSLLLRWLTAVILWLSLRSLWPDKPHQAFWTASLFAVAPVFTQQPVAVAYSQHWICFLLYFLSIYWMLRAYREIRRFYLFTALALAASLVQLLTMEYFLGLELLRPVILWFYFRTHQHSATTVQVFRRTARAAWVYILLLAAFIVWRVFFLQLAEADPNQLVFLEELSGSPLTALIHLGQKMIQDFIFLVSSWLAAVKPADIELLRPFSMAALAAAVFAAVVFGLVFGRYRSKEDTRNNLWHRQAMILGVLAILLGTLPVWLIGRQVSVGPLGSRFSLAAMFGLSLLFVGILEWLSPRHKAKLTVICILIGIAVHANLYTAKVYQFSWEKQRGFYWQLFWRAPHVQPGTAFISEGEIFPYVGLYSTSMGLSLLYPPVEIPEKMPHGFFSYSERLYRYPKELAAGTLLLEQRIRNYSFHAMSEDSIVLDFTPELNRCLHLLSIRDESDRDLPGSIRSILPISDLSRIQLEPLDGWAPPTNIFGPEPEHTWCYYYQRAGLAYQQEDWREVIRLMDEARSQGFAPRDMKENLPLLDAYLKTNQIEPALKLSLQIKGLSDKIDDPVCTMWLEASESNPDPAIGPAFG